MREVQQVGHGDKRVVQGLHGSDPFVGVKSQHLLQQVDELTPVSLLCQNVCSLQVSHVHLQGEQIKEIFCLCYFLLSLFSQVTSVNGLNIN